MNFGRARLLILLMLSVGAPVARAYDIPGFTPDQIIPFKQTTNSTGGAVSLNLDVFTPPGHQATDSRPAIVLFFGGGWVDGSSSHFHPQCEYLASRGMVAISAEYRVKNLHGTTPQECVKDGKSAIRYIREHAASLGIDPNRIAAGGGSAGGHVAAATAILAAYEEPTENLAISSEPNALVIYNGVVDNGPGGYGYSTVQAYWQSISPLYNLQNTPVVPPPTVFFLGTGDALIPVATGQAYQAATEAKGARCDLHLYEGQPHSFFNYDVLNDASGPFYGYRDTLFKTDEFLVSLGYLSNPHQAPAAATGWVTLSGDAGFSGGSAATASPITTVANTDAIAANFDPVTLADGDFIRLTGSVTFNASLTANNFRMGLFDGDNPVTAGDGSGYVGIWAGAPSTTATTISSGNGTGTSNPFETAASTPLGSVPAATATVPANTPVAFTLMIARNSGNLDIHARFSDGTTYIPSQNLLNVAVANITYDSVAFLMTGNLNATQGSFSNIGIETGQVLPAGVPPSGLITYVDAVSGASGNTFATGGSLGDATWVVANATTALDGKWRLRTGVEGNGDTLFQAIPTTQSTPPPIPELTTTLNLANGTYNVWVFFWDQVTDATQNWVISTGLTSGSLTTYSASGQPAVAGATSSGVSNAADLTFASSPVVTAGSGARNLFGVNLGPVEVTGGNLNIYVDMLIPGTGSTQRVWYDGVGYQPVDTTTYTRMLGVDFNRDDVLGSPSQSLFRVVSGSAANPTANASSYAKTFGGKQLTISQPDEVKFEFRGANGDSTRAIPGGDISLSYLVSDFIATRSGAIDLTITGLAAGNYLFRSYHLDTFTGSGLGFAQGTTTTTPNTIQAKIGGAVKASVQPTALGANGLNTTFINNSQIPTLSFGFTHDGAGSLTIELRSTQLNGSDSFLLLNGFELFQANP